MLWSNHDLGMHTNKRKLLPCKNACFLKLIISQYSEGLFDILRLFITVNVNKALKIFLACESHAPNSPNQAN